MTDLKPATAAVIDALQPGDLLTHRDASSRVSRTIRVDQVASQADNDMRIIFGHFFSWRWGRIGNQARRFVDVGVDTGDLISVTSGAEMEVTDTHLDGRIPLRAIPKGTAKARFDAIEVLSNFAGLHVTVAELRKKGVGVRVLQRLCAEGLADCVANDGGNATYALSERGQLIIATVKAGKQREIDAAIQRNARREVIASTYGWMRATWRPGVIAGYEERADRAEIDAAWEWLAALILSQASHYQEPTS